MRALKLLAYAIIANSVSGHPLCFVGDRPTDYDEELTFCPPAQDGACCNDAEEAAVKAYYESIGPLTGDCADLYKQVVCGSCHSYSGHLFEVLGADLGIFDGMTMKEEFCEELLSACEGQLKFPRYSGNTDYCTKHVGGTKDRFWSYPYTEPEIFEPGLNEVFPDLDPDDDFPKETISMRQSPDGSMYWLMGKLGEIKQVNADKPGKISTVVDISGGDFDERGVFYEAYEEGLLDFAFGPMFGVDGYPPYFYLSYNCITRRREKNRNRISKFEYFSGDPVKTRASEEILITGSKRDTSIHAAGWCGFKPSDYGKKAAYHDLYWATGDGGPQTDSNHNGQNTANILGSMLRISVPSDGTGYKIPAKNLGDSPDVLPEICASGFRNPFRCSFDRETDELYCGDVGHTDVEEVNIVECGNNYGWSRFEGSRCQKAIETARDPCATADRSGFTFPLFQYCHPDYHSDAEDEASYTGGVDFCGERVLTGHCVIGGYVYRGQYFADLLWGAYIFGDTTNRNVYFAKREGDGFSFGTIISDASVPIISFSEDVNGELMLITKEHKIYHMPCGDLCASTCLDQADEQPSIKSLGCFGDTKDDRALDRGESPTCEDGGNAMSAEICASYCATIRGATLAGVQFSVECFCGDKNSDYTKHGELPSSSCDMLCAATPGELCGGRNAMEVFELGAPEPSPVLVPAPVSPGEPFQGASYLGCYADSKTERIMAKADDDAYENTDVTAKVCARACGSSEFFGTQFSQECWCGDSDSDYDKHGKGVCTYGCKGDPDEICGGKDAMSVYKRSRGGGEPAPVTPAMPASTEYVGCFADTKEARIMTTKETIDTMSAEVCSSICDGSRYFGTQFSNECWCGTANTDYDKHGSGLCDSACAGNKDEICGGRNSMSVYKSSGASVDLAPVTTTTPASIQYAGCFADTSDARIMKTMAPATNDMTAKVCSVICTGSTSFGTQYGTECWCGDGDYDNHGEGSCDFACSGDKDEICGGRFAMSVYTYTN